MEVKVPDIGDFADVPVIELLVSVGDEVSAEDPLITLESDKATMDVPAPTEGTVTAILVSVGDKVSEGTAVIELDPAVGADARADEPAVDDTADGSAPAAAGEPAPDGDATDDDATADRYDVDVAVIGAGPGGYTAAFRAADLGLQVMLIDRDATLGGVCLNVGCIPSKALLHAAKAIAEAEEMDAHGVGFGAPQVDLDTLIGWKQGIVDRLTGGLTQLAKQRKVEVVTGEAMLTGPHSLAVGDRSVTFGHVIVAVGSTAVKLPMMPDDPRVIDSTGALAPDSIPERLLVVGGGIIGLEMATVYNALGAQVTVVELQDQLIPGADPDLVKPLHKRIAGRYAAIRLETEVTDATAGEAGIEVSFAGGDRETFDRVLVAVGRRPNGAAVGAEAAGVEVDARGFIPVDQQMRTNVPSVLAIGDVVGEPMLAHKATHEAKVAAEVIAGVPGAEFDVRAIPSVAYTDPEVAWMGLTETEAKRDGVAFDRAMFPWAASGRALGLGRPEGFTKLLVDPESRRLLGAGIVGVGAGDLIAETVLGIELGATDEDIALTVHPHPTLSESVGFAAELADGTITDLLPRRTR